MLTLHFLMKNTNQQINLWDLQLGVCVAESKEFLLIEEVVESMLMNKLCNHCSRAVSLVRVQFVEKFLLHQQALSTSLLLHQLLRHKQMLRKYQRRYSIERDRLSKENNDENFFNNFLRSIYLEMTRN